MKIDDMQFGFVPGKGTVDTIFMVRQLQEKFLEKRKDLFFAYVDLENASDREPREVVRWALRQLGVEEWLVQTVMTMYEMEDGGHVQCVGKMLEQTPFNAVIAVDGFIRGVVVPDVLW